MPTSNFKTPPDVRPGPTVQSPDGTQFLANAGVPILTPRREPPRNQPATGRTNHDAPRRSAVPAVRLVPVRPGATWHSGQTLRPGAHPARRYGAVALPRGLAAPEERADSRGRALQHDAQGEVGQDDERPQH